MTADLNAIAESPSSKTKWNRLSWVVAVALLMIVHLVLIGTQIQSQTPTLDEVAHLPAGQTYLENGTFKLYRHSPPFARALAALVGWGSRPELVYDRSWSTDEPASHWRFAFETIAYAARDETSRATYLQFFSQARWGIAFLSAWTIPLLFCWGNAWFGPRAGLLPAALWTICPNILAHAGLVTTDLAATSAGLAACFAFSRWLDQPTAARFSLAALLLGLAQLIKFSSLWLYLIFAAWIFLRYVRVPRELLRRSIAFALVVAGSMFVINVGYLFEGTGKPLGAFPFLSQSLTRPRTNADGPIPASNNLTYLQVWQTRTNRFHGTWLANLPTPLPLHFVAGFDEQKFEAEGKYPMYLRGKFADPLPSSDPAAAPKERRGWWYYYLYCLAVKVPPSTWILVTAALLTSLFLPLPRSVLPLVALAFVPLVAMSFLTDINLGLRYVLPALPFFFLIAGSLVATHRPGRWTVLAAILLVWNAVETFSIHPHEISYFNRLAGGPTAGRFHLIDSNIDWGQDLRALARWLDENPEWKKEIRLAYAGSVPPEFEGITDYRLAPRDLRFVPDPLLLPWEQRDRAASWGPLPGKYAVSVNFERGMRFHTPAPLQLFQAWQGRLGRAALPGSTMIEVPRGSYAYFQNFEPIIIPRVGYSILLYDISLEDANKARAAMGLPLLP